MKQIIILMLGALVVFQCCKTKNSKEQKPNILFIFSDDQTYKSVNALGNEEVITPHIDKLVKSGVTFTHSYNMGSWNGAVCVFSRAMVNTGRYLWHIKDDQIDGYKEYTKKRKFWSQLMEEAGYDTYMSGKWYLNYPVDSVFQTVTNPRPGMPNSVPEAYNRPLSREDSTWLPWHRKYNGYWKDGTHWSEVLANDAISFINQAKNKNNPFFMYLAFNAAHDPRQSPKQFIDKYPLEDVAVPASFQPMYPYKDSIGCGPGLRDARLAPFPRTEYAVKVHRQEYYSIITHMDQQIGRIISQLQKSGMDQNTYILFTADHGLAVGEQGLFGKQNLYDHSMRVPCILVGPNIPKNEKRDMQVYLQDLMATSLDLAGIEKPDYVEFNSLMPLINDKSRASPYNEIYGAYSNLQRAVRTEKYKLIAYPKAKKIRLYDMINDPEEINDLADNPEYTDIIKNLANKLKKQQEIMDDPLDLHPYFPELF